MTYSNDLKSKILKKIKEREYSVEEIISIFDISKSTFYKIKYEFDKKPICKSKKETKITPRIKSYIGRYVTRKINFEYEKIISKIKKKFDIEVSKSTIYNVLRIKKIKKKKLYEKLILSNKIKRDEQIKIFKNQLKKIPVENIISIDETSIDTHISAKNGWSKSGKKLISKRTNKRIRYTVISAVGYNGFIYNKIIKGSCNGEIFLKFIKGLLSKLPDKRPKTLLLDNARIHHFLKFKNYVRNVRNVSLLYNVPYSPETNPIEKVFSEVKRDLRKVSIDNNNIIRRINKSFLNVKKNNIEQYFKKSFNFY